MSDPVSNEDIEDVLSSIRRLVSDEPIKGAPRRKFATVDNVERFVLTPDFRVAEADLTRGVKQDEIVTSHSEGQNEGENGTFEVLVHQDPGEEHGDNLDAPELSQDEIDLGPYQSDSEWLETTPEETTRAEVETQEHSESQGHTAEPLFLEPSANQDGPPSLVDHHVRAPVHPDETFAASNDINSKAAVDADQSTDDFWQDPSESTSEPSNNPKGSGTEDAFEMDISSLFQDDTPEAPPQAGSAEAFSEDGGHPSDMSEQEDEAPRVILSGQTSLEKRIAELEAALQNSAQEWEPDGSEEELTDETRPLSFGKDSQLAKAITLVAHELEKNAPEPDEKWQPATQTTGPAPIESLYSDVVQSAESASESDLDLTGGDSVEWRDVEQEWAPDIDADSNLDVVADVRDGEAAHNSAAMQAASFAASQETAEADGDNDLFALDEPTMLDEEALQELVADIVRQELQGVLGERITRNVRRLVRREIKRALAMRDLE